MELEIPTDEQMKRLGTKTCSMCFETKAYKLQELITPDNSLGVVQQASLLLDFGYKLEDKFCEDCFWK